MMGMNDRLSRKSQHFLENLRVYLISSGKKEGEIDDIVQDLEDHLHEAEKNGKSIDKIIGQSPKAYMEQLSSEMSLDYAWLLKYIPIIVLGVFCYVFVGDAMRGGIELSMLQMIGYPLVGLASIIIYAVGFKQMASRKLSRLLEIIIFFFIGIIPIALFMGLIIADNFYLTPTIEFSALGNVLAVVCSIGLFVALAIWSKMWTPVIIPVILFLPEYLISFTAFQESTKAMLTSIAFIVGAWAYIIIALKASKKTSS